MGKLLSKDEEKMAKCLVDMAVRNAIATELLKFYLKDEKNRQKINNYLKKYGD